MWGINSQIRKHVFPKQELLQGKYMRNTIFDCYFPLGVAIYLNWPEVRIDRLVRIFYNPKEKWEIKSVKSSHLTTSNSIDFLTFTENVPFRTKKKMIFLT